MSKRKKSLTSPSRSLSTENIVQEPAAELLVNQPSKWKNFWIRGLFTCLMMLGFAGILYLGHAAVIGLVIVVQLLVYREVISIGIGPTKLKGGLPWLRSLHYYLLLSTNYFLYGESFIYYFKPYVLVDAFLMPLATHHRIISFILYCFGFMFFVLKLKKGMVMQ